MKSRRLSGLRSVSKFVLAGLTGVIATGVLIFVMILNSRPDLSIWHLADLDEEFTTDSDVTTFDQYLTLEDRLFEQLDSLVYAEVPRNSANAVNRYSRGSLSDPARWPVNWNRTFEMRHADPRAGILLLHGLSDSPYSMRALARSLHAHGASVIGLRLPGHGTAPSGLVGTRWQDMAAAVRLAARHLHDTVGNRPVYVVGYSNGGALAVEYALSTLADTSLPTASGVILLSPEIGVAPVAALAAWQGRLGHALRLDKLAWNNLLPEYDPFKYGSFAVNAGDLAHRITAHIQKQLTALKGNAGLEGFPPILAFQSSVDATVTASAVIANLFDQLPAANHELVLFDINRRVEVGSVLKRDPRTVFLPLLRKAGRTFDLTIVTNEDETSNRVVALTATRGEESLSVSAHLAEWPAGIFSLSHVALPFSPSDPLYGGPDAGESPGIRLGNLALRGERDVLQISGTDMLRLRWNPFFDYVETRILQFTGLSEP